MSYIDVTGKTEDEAIRKALEQLHMDRDDVSVEILERAKSGFLGIGSSPARVRVTYGQEEPEAPTAPVQPEKKPEPRPQPKPEQPKTRKPGLPGCQTLASQNCPGCCPPGAVCPGRQRPAHYRVPDGPAGAYGQPCPGAGHGDGKRPLQCGAGGTEAGAQRLARGLGRLRQATNYAVNSGREKRIRVHVDAENYRAKAGGLRACESGAKVTAKVTRHRRNVTPGPRMLPRRHVIHAALQDVPGVNTYSIKARAQPPVMRPVSRPR